MRPCSAQAARYSPFSVTVAGVQVRPDRYETMGSRARFSACAGRKIERRMSREVAADAWRACRARRRIGAANARNRWSGPVRAWTSLLALEFVGLRRRSLVAGIGRVVGIAQQKLALAAPRRRRVVHPAWDDQQFASLQRHR